MNKVRTFTKNVMRVLSVFMLGSFSAVVSYAASDITGVIPHIDKQNRQKVESFEQKRKEQEYKEFAQKLEAQIKPTADKEREEILALNKTVLENSKKYKKELLCDIAKKTNTEIESIVGDDQQSDSNSKHNKANQIWKGKQIYIFISTSMNEKNLMSLAMEAKEHDASLVIRGFLDNSYMKTAQFLERIIEKTGQGISIDPELFKKFQITEVPTVVVTDNNSCDDFNECTPRYDKISGNIGIDDALSKIKDKGEVFKRGIEVQEKPDASQSKQEIFNSKSRGQNA